MAFDASMSIAQVSAETGLREHVVRHALKGLVESGTIRLRPYVSPYSLGLMEFHAEVVVESPGQAALSALAKAFVESPTSTFVGEVTGDYHLSVMFLARSLAGIPRFFNHICAKLPEVKFRKSVSAVLGVTVAHPKRGTKPLPNSAISYSAADKPQKFDEVDERILVLLGSGAFSSRRELAAQCGVPQSTLDYRIQGLQQRGVLLSIGYTMPDYSDGLSRYALRITASSPCAELRERLQGLTGSHQAVRWMLQLAGNCDYVLGVRLSQPGMVSAFTHELRRHLDPFVSKVDVLPELFTHKTYINPEDLDVLRRLGTADDEAAAAPRIAV